MRHLLIIVTTATCVTTMVRIADACSPSQCSPVFFVPGNGNTVPANLPVVYWRPHSGHGVVNDLALVTLATASAPSVKLPFTATKVENTRDYLLVPEQPLVDGTTYVLADGNECMYDNQPTPDVVFQVGPTAPLPSTLGTLSVGAVELTRFDVWTISGVCVSEVEASSARVELRLADDAVPWRDALHLETLVDGLHWYDAYSTGAELPPGSNNRGRGLDLVFRICHTDDPGVLPGVYGGVHEVMMRATLPGTDLVLTTPPVSIQLDCPPEELQPTPEPPEVLDAAGCSTTNTSTLPWWTIALMFGCWRRRRSAEL